VVSNVRPFSALDCAKFSKWLAVRPGVEITARDRASCYAQGVAAGAPGAQQVADRWHLLHNVREALIRVAHRGPYCHKSGNSARPARGCEKHDPAATPLSITNPGTFSGSPCPALRAGSGTAP
jgi:hypothetical protein